MCHHMIITSITSHYAVSSHGDHDVENDSRKFDNQKGENVM
jgi:hypothetical protein